MLSRLKSRLKGWGPRPGDCGFVGFVRNVDNMAVDMDMAVDVDRDAVWIE